MFGVKVQLSVTPSVAARDMQMPTTGHSGRDSGLAHTLTHVVWLGLEREKKTFESTRGSVTLTDWVVGGVCGGEG